MPNTMASGLPYAQRYEVISDARVRDAITGLVWAELGSSLGSIGGPADRDAPGHKAAHPGSSTVRARVTSAFT